MKVQAVDKGRRASRAGDGSGVTYEVVSRVC